MASLIAGIAFLVVAGIAFVVSSLAEGETPEQIVHRRLEAVRKAQSRGSDSANLKLVRDELLSDLPTLNRLLTRWAWSRKLQALIDQAGMKTRPGQIVLLSLVVALGAGLIANGLISNVGLSVLAALAGVCVPMTGVAIQRRRRMHAFERYFPEALDLLARAVRAGHAFPAGLEMIGKELSEPVGGEFRAAFEEQNLGLPLRDSLLNLAERMPLLDVRFFITALMVQKETGGNLAEILDNLAKVIRERFRIYGEVRTRTAQGRMTALVLILLPLIMMVTLQVMSPSYIDPLYHTRTGQLMLAGAFVAQVVGTIAIWKIVDVQV